MRQPVIGWTVGHVQPEIRQTPEIDVRIDPVCHKKKEISEPTRGDMSREGLDMSNRPTYRPGGC
jgi:hypothetical protein